MSSPEPLQRSQIAPWEVNSRERIRAGAIFLAVTLAIFACHSFVAFAAVRMAGVSLFACALSIVAFYLSRTRQDTLISSNLLVTSLFVQVFGEMLLNGGLSAPATPLATLIVPAAYLLCPHGSRSMLRWCLLVALSLVLVGLLESSGLTLANELDLEAQRLDKLLSIVLGVLGAAYLTRLFENQTSSALTQLANERRKYRQIALYDSLTGLPNRDNLFAYTKQLFEASRETNKTYHLVFLDVDRFKRINDTMGHATGDVLLQQVGERLRRFDSTDSFAARLAGDEFILIREARSADSSGEELLGRLRTLFSQPFDLDGKQQSVNLSAGLACFPQDGDSLATLMPVADERMYEQKGSAPSQRKGFPRQSPGTVNASTKTVDVA